MHWFSYFLIFILTFPLKITYAASISFTCSGTVETEITTGPNLNQIRQSDTFNDRVNIQINHEKKSFDVIFGDRDFRFTNKNCFYDGVLFECSRNPIEIGGREATFINDQGGRYYKQSWDAIDKPKALIIKTYTGNCYSSSENSKLF